MYEEKNGSRERDMMKISRKTYDQLRQQRRELILDKKDLQRTVLTMGNDMLKLRQQYGDTCASLLQLSGMFFELIHMIEECCEKKDDKRKIYEMVVRGAELFFNDCADPDAAELMSESKKNAGQNSGKDDGDASKMEKGVPDANNDDYCDWDYADEEDEDVTDYIPPEVRKILASYQKKH